MSEYSKRPTFFDNIHYCGGKQKIEEDYFKIQKEIHDEVDSVFIPPTCYKCNKELVVGDYVDGFHPYHQEYNSCANCKDSDNDDDYPGGIGEGAMS